MGHTVNFRSTKESYKRKQVTLNPEEDWQIIENTHAPIVDAEIWRLAQQTRTVVHRTDKTGVANPLTGLMFCADCGAKMYNHRGQLDPKKPNGGIDPVTHLAPNDHYDCATYSGTFYHVEKKCCAHYISTKAVRALVLDAIRRVSQYAIANREEFIRKVREASEVQQSQQAKELKKQVAKARKRSTELDSLIKKLYESFAMGKISEERFDLLLADYEQEQKEVNALAATEQQELDAYAQDTDRINQFLALAKKYTDFTELTPQMIYEFVDRIEVHASQKIDGERVQDVDIHLKYIGKFEVPMAEQEAAVDPEEERKRKRRAYQREYKRKKKLEREAAEAAEKADSPQAESA